MARSGYITGEAIDASLTRHGTQDKPVKGRVTDSLGNPVAGASVTVKGTSIGTQTNQGGKFILTSVADGAILVVSFLGSETQEVPISRTNMHIVLQDGSDDLDEVVVVGYSTRKVRYLSSSVTTVSSEKL